MIKKKSVEHKLLPKRLPTSGRFAEKIGVNRVTVYEWMKAHKEFFDAYMIAKEILKENLTDIGLAGAALPQSFIFVATNLTDMKVQSNVDHTTKGKPITDYEHLEEEYAIQLRKTANPAPLSPVCFEEDLEDPDVF